MSAVLHHRIRMHIVIWMACGWTNQKRGVFIQQRSKRMQLWHWYWCNRLFSMLRIYCGRIFIWANVFGENTKTLCFGRFGLFRWVSVLFRLSREIHGTMFIFSIAIQRRLVIFVLHWILVLIQPMGKSWWPTSRLGNWQYQSCYLFLFLVDFFMGT